mgnify:CR=1 FL=1
MLVYLYCKASLVLLDKNLEQEFCPYCGNEII